jgi:hypothetical protein
MHGGSHRSECLATVITTTSQVNPAGSCSVSLAPPFGFGQAHANVNATLYLPVLGSPSTPVGGEIGADIGVFTGIPSPDINTVGRAEFSISLDLLFSTPGPVRSGFMQMSFIEGFGFGTDGPDSATKHVSIGSSLPPPTIFPGDLLNAGTTPLFPFTLGEDFLFHEDLAMEASDYPNFGIFESAVPKLHWTFTLFEADGVTPVQIALATPEPASWWFLGCGCFCLLAFGRRRRHLSPTP